MAKNRNTFNKRRREVEKKQQAEDKRTKKRLRQAARPDSPDIIISIPLREPAA